MGRSPWRVVLTLWALAGGALAVALLRRSQWVRFEWRSYVPLTDDEGRQYVDSFDGLGVLDPRMWLGLAIGLALAGVLVLLLARQAAHG